MPCLVFRRRRTLHFHAGNGGSVLRNRKTEQHGFQSAGAGNCGHRRLIRGDIGDGRIWIGSPFLQQTALEHDKELAATIESERSKLGKLIKEAGITSD